jgi:bifunctional non-homologous end joining protein LigD
MPTDTLPVPPFRHAGLPRVAPVPLVSRAEPFDDPAWIFEPKYDGFRAFLYGAGKDCEIETSRHLDVDAQDLRSRVSAVLGSREAILDGQIVSLDRQGKPVLQQLLRGEGYLAFAAYDLLWIDGSDLRDRPLKIRKQQLAELLPEDTGPLYKVLSIEEHGRALFGAIRQLGLSGIVAKSQEDPYSPATMWYAIRNPGYCPPIRGPRSSGSRIVIETQPGNGDAPALTRVPRLA